MRVELAGENLVGMCRFEQPVADLLNSLHPCLIIDLDVWLGAGHTEATKVFRVVDGMIAILFIKADMLDRISHLGSPTDD